MADAKCKFCSGSGKILLMYSTLDCLCTEVEFQKKRADRYKIVAEQFLTTICQIADVIYKILPDSNKTIAMVSKKHFKKVSEIIDAGED